MVECSFFPVLTWLVLAEDFSKARTVLVYFTFLLILVLDCNNRKAVKTNV